MVSLLSLPPSFHFQHHHFFHSPHTPQLYIIPLHTAEVQQFTSTETEKQTPQLTIDEEMRKRFGLVMNGEEFVVGRENASLQILDKKVSRRVGVIRCSDGFSFFLFFFFFLSSSLSSSLPPPFSTSL
jgi:hypothetical protein